MYDVSMLLRKVLKKWKLSFTLLGMLNLHLLREWKEQGGCPKKNVFVSSPYERAIQTIKELADVHKKDIIIFEDLKEREIGMLSDMSFQEAKYILYKDRSYSFPDGESSIDAQERASKVMEYLLSEYLNKKIVIGTHGDIMTLMLNYFNDDHGFEFWKSTSMPDIYRLVFHGTELKTVSRVWRTA